MSEALRQAQGTSGQAQGTSGQAQGTSGQAQGTSGQAQGTTDLRVAVLGVGMMGAFHADALATRTKGARVVVINDFAADKAAEVAARVGARVVDDPIAAINDPEVDAVLIATPGKAHAEQVQACLDAGKPVLCEKPLTTDEESSYALVQAEARLGQPLVQLGFMRRFDTEYAALRELIASGGLGNPLIVHCTHRNPAVPDFFNSEFMMRDSVVHEVDVARFLLDEEIVSVQVLRGVATRAAPQGTSDPMVVVFETESGRLVTDEIYVRTNVAYEVRTEVVGEDGTATIGLDVNLVRTAPGGGWGGRSTPGFVERFGQAYDTELQRWVAAARRGTIDGPGVWDGYAAVAVCEAGAQAVRTGEKVRVVLQPRPTPSPEPVEGQAGSSTEGPSTSSGNVATDAGKADEPEPGLTAPDLIGDRP